MNELSNIAERVGADIEQVRHGIGSDRRIGYHFIYPGIPEWATAAPASPRTSLHRTAQQHGYDARILTAVEQVNSDQKDLLFHKINAHFDGDLDGRTIAIWGLAFKPNTDDMREAPSRRLMEHLWEAGAKVRAYDPEAMEETRRIYSEAEDLKLCELPMDAVKSADALAVLTEWKIFWSPDFEAMKKALKHPVVFDGRNIYEPERMAALGFNYYSIGRKPAPMNVVVDELRPVADA